MGIDNEQLAQKVVDTFKKSISEEGLSHISENEFHELAQIVEEALSRNLSEAAERVAAVAKELKNEAGHPDLDL